MELTVEQKQAIAIASARRRKEEAQGTPDPVQRPQVTYTQEPYTEPEMADPLTVSDTGVESSQKDIRATVRNVMQGVSFGTADELEAALRSAFGDQTYAENIAMIRDEMKTYSANNPEAAATQELVGAIMTPATLLKAPKYIERLSPLARGSVKGGTGGFVYGVGSAEGGLGERTEEGLVSAGVGILIGGPLEKALSSLGNIRINRTVKRQQFAPTVENLRTLRDQAYDAVDQSMFAVGPGEMRDMLLRASKIADDAEYITMPNVTTAVDKARKLLESKVSQGMTLGQAENVRRRLFKLAEDPTDGYIIRKMITEFDDVIDNSLAKEGSAALKVARAAHSKYAKVRTLEEAFEGAELGKGRSADVYRSVAKKLLSGDQRKLKYFTEQEKQLLQTVRDGKASQRVLDWFGNFTPTAKGLAGALNFTAFAINPWLAVMYIGTSGAKYVSNQQTIKRAKEVIKQVGGVKEIKKISEMPNAATFTAGGVTADQLREEFLLKGQDNGESVSE